MTQLESVLNGLLPLILLGIAALAVLGALAGPALSGSRTPVRRRVASLVRARQALRGSRPATPAGADQTIERRDAVVRHGRLELVLQQAGLGRSPMFYGGIGLIAALVLVAVLLVVGANLAGALLLGVAGSGLGFALFVLRARRQRLERIEREFPAALDIMVRSLRAGLPVDEGLRVVAQEAAPIVAREFNALVNEMAIGLTLTDAVARMADRVAVPDVRMFAVVLGLQRSSGGSAASALEAVAETLRSRQTLRQKISIMSSEARASAAIIGSLPVVLIVILYVVSPDYIGLLFTTVTGRVIVAVTVGWMLLGVQVMRSMIHFDA